MDGWGAILVFQSCTLSSSTLQLTHLARVYQELFLPFVCMVGCLMWHVSKFNFPQPSPAQMEEIRIFIFSYSHRRRHVTYSELPTKYMWESCKSSFLGIKLVYASRTVLWPDFVAQATPKRHVMARVVMNFTLWLTKIQNSFRNIDNFLDIYRISYRVDHRTTQLTKRTRRSRYF
jgi:hypothetical protein